MYSRRSRSTDVGADQDFFGSVYDIHPSDSRTLLTFLVGLTTGPSMDSSAPEADSLVGHVRLATLHWRTR
jgi:hypothetical protein